MRHRDRRIVIALPDFTYAVILADRGDHIMLWTAYVVDASDRRKRCGLRGREVAGKTPSKADVARTRTTSLLLLHVVDEPF